MVGSSLHDAKRKRRSSLRRGAQDPPSLWYGRAFSFFVCDAVSGTERGRVVQRDLDGIGGSKQARGEREGDAKELERADVRHKAVLLLLGTGSQ
jgi:hypothetical protein